jgi:hypothetical protein
MLRIFAFLQVVRVHHSSKQIPGRVRKLIAILFVFLLPAVWSVAEAQSLSCTIAVKARWTLPPGTVGSIGLKSAVDDKDSIVRVENGNWQLLDDHSFGRAVRFHPDGRWEDRYKQCQYCRERVIRGVGTWHMREEVQPGCDYRRQYAFYLFIRDESTTKLLSEKRIFVPGVQSYMRRGLRLIDLGDLGKFF